LEAGTRKTALKRIKISQKMKSNEFRIGNYAFYDNKQKGIHHKLTVIKIMFLSPLPSVKFPDKKTWNVDFSDLQPIPITGEWLRRFGFNKEDNWFKYPIVNDWSFIYWRVTEGCSLSVSKHGFDLSNIKYVHQLQNLIFAFTGEELKEP
jgi:hypothetical protein